MSEYRNLFESFLVGDWSGFEPHPVAEPTRALPGSKEKVAAIAARVERGEEAWHPEDGPEDDD